MSDVDNNATIAAYWLLGVHGAWSIRGIPKWVDRQELFKHYTTALAVARGGTFRGPRVIWELMTYVEKLSARVTPPIRFDTQRSK